MSKKKDHKRVAHEGFGNIIVDASLPSNPLGKLNLDNQLSFNVHRSGWGYALDALGPLHNENGVIFDGFLEYTFSWNKYELRDKGLLPYKEPWVGFFHNPQDAPFWLCKDDHIETILEGELFQESLDSCLGLFALSDYHASYLRHKTSKPVSSLIHPTEIPGKIFSFDDFIANKRKKIVQIGVWLRRLNSIYQLPLEKGVYTKVRLVQSNNNFQKFETQRYNESQMYNLQFEKKYWDNTLCLSFVPNDQYDLLLTQNISFLHFFDASANNSVIECIARATPLLVNPLPAVKEYLGEDYPFYFNTLEEAAEKAMDFNLVQKTHEYLLNCEIRKKLSQEYFLESFKSSEIYQSLSSGELEETLNKISKLKPKTY